jgi:colanic acid biosynthesis glycosyl transferase WcaI
MNIILHDCGGYAFTVQLSRELARRGHKVLHLFSTLVPRKGHLWGEADDPPSLSIEEISIGETYQKNNLAQRYRQERLYGRKIAERIMHFDAQVVFNANSPLMVSSMLLRQCHRFSIHYIHWAQDIHSLAVRTVMSRRIPILGGLVARYFTTLERMVFEKANALIVISADFVTELQRLNIYPKQIYTIPNWMPIDEMGPAPKRNPWSLKHDLDETLNIMYAGSLGFKHHEDTFIELARHFSSRKDVRIVVVGEGIVFNRLMELKQSQDLNNLILLPWQRYEDLPFVLAAGDVLFASMTPDASAFSVPCKVLSYLSAARAVLAAIPEGNYAAKILLDEGIGLVVHPEDTTELLESAEKLVSSAILRESIARAGRVYAERMFDIERIGDRFEELIEEVTGSPAIPGHRISC